MVETVLLTGGAGFIGRHAIEHMLENTDWNIICMDRLTYAGNLNGIADSDVYKKEGHRIKYVYHDFRAPIIGNVASRIGQVDYIIHMGAESHVENSMKDPELFAHSNVIGTVNMLEFARLYQTNLKKFVLVSTDEVFGSAPDDYFYTEEDRFRPSNPYSASKAGACMFGMAYRTCYGMPIYITHTMNNFGERQHPEKFLPLVIKKVLNEEVVTIHGNKDEIGSRTWLHARNHADGILFLLSNDVPIGDYNISGNVEMTNLEIAEKIAGTIGKPLKYELMDFHKTRPGHDRRYALDGSKLKNAGWNPPVQFEDSLKNMVLWTLDHPDWLKE